MLRHSQNHVSAGVCQLVFEVSELISPRIIAVESDRRQSATLNSSSETNKDERFVAVHAPAMP